MNAPMPNNETERLAALNEYHIFDTEAEQSYDDITALAAHICQVPMAMISLVDEVRQWFKSKVGVEQRQTPREIAFCAHAILQREPLTIPDTKKDRRFSDNALVTGEPYVRFYAGFPLINPEGLALGTLCVKDRKPRHLSLAQEAGDADSGAAGHGPAGIEADFKTPGRCAEPCQHAATVDAHLRLVQAHP